MANKQTAEKLTAMEQLINWIDSDCTPMDCVMKAKELLEMEKEQIMDAWDKGDYCIDLPDGSWKQKYESGEQYYFETYGN